MDAGNTRAPTWPLVDYVYTALLDSKGETREAFDHADPGEWALLVDTDGTLYHRPNTYVGDRALGNVFDQPIGEILGSERYTSSLQRDRALVSANATGAGSAVRATRAHYSSRHGS